MLLYYRTLESVKIESAKIKSAKFFIAFLDDLGNFKHFEPYLFFSYQTRVGGAALSALKATENSSTYWICKSARFFCNSTICICMKY